MISMDLDDINTKMAVELNTPADTLPNGFILRISFDSSSYFVHTSITGCKVISGIDFYDGGYGFADSLFPKCEVITSSILEITQFNRIDSSKSTIWIESTNRALVPDTPALISVKLFASAALVTADKPSIEGNVSVTGTYPAFKAELNTGSFSSFSVSSSSPSVNISG